MAATQQIDSVRYDRQLRLWGADAQAALQASRVCVLGATALATEFVKNLVLPGVGSFVIVEGRSVTEADVGHSFFVEGGDVGKPLAEVVCTHLVDLNPATKGDFVKEQPARYVASQPGFVERFSLVVCSQQPESTVAEVGKLCWAAGTPLIVLRSYGMVGYVRLVLKDHSVIDTKVDPPVFDLRITKPFPALLAHAKTFDLKGMSRTDHGHVPFVVLLVLLLEEWRAQNPGANPVPTTAIEKSQFRKFVESSRREGGMSAPEENFDEAIHSLRHVYTPYSIPPEVAKIFGDPLVTAPLASLRNIPKFFVLARAVRDFVSNEGQGCLPLAGEIPDMAATTSGYLALKKIYQDKAKEDLAVVGARVAAVCTEAPGAERPTKDDVKLFCKCAASVRHFNFSPIAAELDPKAAIPADIATALRTPADIPGSHRNNAILFCLLRAVELYFKNNRAYPGATRGSGDAGVTQLSRCLDDLFSNWGATQLRGSIPNDFVVEMVRFGGCELHTTSALAGGVGAQEAIKALTHQMIPVNNTFVWNGIHGSSSAFEV